VTVRTSSRAVRKSLTALISQLGTTL
jgi:hypothetical protein